MKKALTYSSRSVSLAERFRQRSREKNSTIYDFVNDFLCKYLSPDTKRAYAKDMNDFFDFLRMGDVLVHHPKDIEAYHFQEYRDWLIESGLKSATINRRMVAVRAFMKWALALGMIQFNPLDAVKLPKVQTEMETVAFDDEEAVRMIQAPDTKTHSGRMHRLAMVLLFNLGLRRAELANVQLGDIFEDRGHMVLRVHGKGDKTRLIALSEYVQNELKAYLNSFEAKWFWEEDDYILQKDGKVKSRKAIDGSTVYRIVDRYAERLGINKRVSPHSCRATVISHLLDTKKVPIREVAGFAGHSSVLTTQRYDKRLDSLNRNASYSVDLKDEKAG